MFKYLAPIAAASVCAFAAQAQEPGGPSAPASSTVFGVVSVTGEAALPMVGFGAPNYSPEQTASFLCDAEGRSPVLALNAQVAHDATLKARSMRVLALNGEASERELEQAELDRQFAVRKLAGRGEAAQGRATYSNVSIENVRYRRVIENGRAVLLVTGSLQNRGDKGVELPPVSIETVDARGFVLAGQTTQFDQVSIDAGQQQAFTLRFKNPPQYAVKVQAFFAPPFLNRNFRGCDFFDPMTFDASQAAMRRTSAQTAPVAVPKVGSGAPVYTAVELAMIYRATRADAEATYNAGTPGSRSRIDACSPLQPWRGLMILADKVEEAWIATNAAEEVRRDAARGVFLPGEVEEAELARQAAVRAMMAARPPVRDLTQGAHAGLVIDKVEPVSANGDVTVSGKMRNMGDGSVNVPPLLVSVRDRFGFVVTETVYRPGGRLRPGNVGTFTVKFSAPQALVGGATAQFAC